MISKEYFVECIDKITKEMKYFDDLQSLMIENNYDNCIMYPKTLGLSIDLLAEALELDDNGKDFYNTWVYDYDFGRDFEIGYVKVKDSDDKEYLPDLSTPEKYYDFVLEG